MTKWKILAGTAILSGALLVPAVVLAAPDGDHGPRHHKERMLEHMAEQLQLTEGQRAQLKANREAGRERRKAARAEMRQVRKQLREAIESGADEATVEDLGIRLGHLEVARAKHRQEQRMQFESILTDEQKAKMEELRAERQARHKEHRARWQERNQ